MQRFARCAFTSALALSPLTARGAAQQAPLTAPSQDNSGGPLGALAACVAESAVNGWQMPDPADPAVTIVEANSDGIEQQMPYIPRDPRIPESIQGLWWMDGNPFGLLTTFANASWEESTRTASLRMYEPGSFSFYAVPWEDCQFKGIIAQKVRFRVVFNAAYDFATLINETTAADGQTVVNKNIIYTMQQVADGHWVRRSWINGVRADYQLRRIVDRHGKREAAYDDYLKIATATSSLGKPVKAAAGQ